MLKAEGESEERPALRRSVTTQAVTVDGVVSHCDHRRCAAHHACCCACRLSAMVTVLSIGLIVVFVSVVVCIRIVNDILDISRDQVATVRL